MKNDNFQKHLYGYALGILKPTLDFTKESIIPEEKYNPFLK